MKIFRLLLLPFAIALASVSCGPKQPTSKPESEAPTEFKPEFPIHIQLSESHEYKNTMPFTTLTDVVADIRYVPLETGPDCLISGASSQPQFSKDFIFIISRDVLLQFDKQGKFIRKINVPGKGPENCSVGSYGIDEKNRLIYIFDHIRGIHTFTFNGEHIKANRNPFSEMPGTYSGGFVFDEVRGNLIFTDFQDMKGNEPYKYIVTDAAGTILYQCPNYTQYNLRKPTMIDDSVQQSDFYSTPAQSSYNTRPSGSDEQIDRSCCFIRKKFVWRELRR